MALPTSAQTIGPFFRVALARPAWSDLTRDGCDGEPVLIAGRVLDGDGAAVPDALLELWQADAHGRHAPDGERGFRGWGRACTDGEGRYAFRTVVPGALEAGGGRQAPHADVSVFARGLLKRLVTRIYFADHAAENARDPLLASIADETARRTLIAPRDEPGGEIAVYRFDIVLQGEGETAFLAL